MHQQFSHARERPAAGSGEGRSRNEPGRRRVRVLGPVIVSLLIVLQLFLPVVMAGPQSPPADEPLSVPGFTPDVSPAFSGVISPACDNLSEDTRAEIAVTPVRSAASRSNPSMEGITPSSGATGTSVRVVIDGAGFISDATVYLTPVDADPEHRGSIAGGDNSGASLENPHGIFVRDSYAYVAGTNSNALEIFDISDPANPAVAGRTDLGRYNKPTNSDDDELWDIVEIEGFLDPFGNTQTSDPDNSDTDGDGLSDSDEAGVLHTDANGHTFWKVRSNPLMVDSDADSLDDYLELIDLGTDPLQNDTDRDWLPDGYEWHSGTDPTDPDTDGDRIGDLERYSCEYYEYDFVRNFPWRDNEIANEICLGFTQGEWADENHEDNTFYQIGQFISEISPLGSARDAYIDYQHGDSINTVLNAIGVIPGAKFETALVTFIGKHTGRITTHFLALVGKGKITYKVAKAKLPAQIMDLLKRRGLSESRIAKLLEKTALKGFNLDKITHISELNGKFFVVHIPDESGNMKYFLQSIDGERYIPITNGRYAGTTYKNVKYDIDGFPKFDAIDTHHLKPDSYLLGKKAQEKECNEALREKIKDPAFRNKFTTEQITDIKKGITPSGLTWHHHQETGKMQLVDAALHKRSNAPHVGGYAIWGKGSIE